VEPTLWLQGQDLLEDKIVPEKARIFSEGVLGVGPGGQSDRSSAEVDVGILSLPLLFGSDA
jgi:hypothetical protein